MTKRNQHVVPHERGWAVQEPAQVELPLSTRHSRQQSMQPAVSHATRALNF